MDLKEKAKKTAKSQLYYNRTAKDLSVLKPGDMVTIKPEGFTKGQQCRKGLIVQKHPFGRQTPQKKPCTPEACRKTTECGEDAMSKIPKLMSKSMPRKPKA